MEDTRSLGLAVTKARRLRMLTLPYHYRMREVSMVINLSPALLLFCYKYIVLQWKVHKLD